MEHFLIPVKDKITSLPSAMILCLATINTKNHEQKTHWCIVVLENQ